MIKFSRLLFFLLLPMALTAGAQTIFPLKLSANKKYLVDSRNKPFLIREISAWGLIQALSEKDEAALMDSVKKKGFNTLMVSIISYDTRFAGGPPNWQGISPFKVKWDLSTYDTTYFAHADRFLHMAKSKGMLVLLVPCYMGYKGDANQGWWGKVLDAHNSPEKSRIYGEFLGKRYKNFSNIIWEAGGDNPCDSPLYAHMDNIIRGIKAFDQGHLWTGHFESVWPTDWSSGDKRYAKYIDLDGLYDFEEKNLGDNAPQYKTELARYGKGRMIFQLDQSYEQDIPHGKDNTDYQIIRRKNYDGLLSGCAGTSFSPGTPDTQCYTLTSWQPLMNTLGMRQMRLCFKLFRSRPWQKLVPDTGTRIIADRGQFGSTDYICAAKASDGSTYIAYLPAGRSIEVNLKQLHMNRINQWWYNPRNGAVWSRGSFPSTVARETFIAPDEGDWVLVLDNREAGFKEPGQAPE
ncbi:MAG: DUF4038 domain-containing protein [Bacteroidetes bacterium]|nr:DUF4038 domain-containing protein [Bacteroidota bacterium]